MSDFGNIMLDKCLNFAVRVVNLCDFLNKEKKEFKIADQLYRSGTSIGANIHEANYSSSKADFINKFQIALKECYETEYWLGVFHDSSIVTDEEYSDIFTKCSKNS